ncbi:MAG: hypothetical protein WA864_22715, partial [Acetobacteraceae bacterium]
MRAAGIDNLHSVHKQLRLAQRTKITETVVGSSPVARHADAERAPASLFDIVLHVAIAPRTAANAASACAPSGPPACA